MGTQGMLEVWRGGVNAWECDSFGHMNMQFYLGRAAEGLQGLAAAMGQPRAFTADAAATFSVTRQHLRFLAEARVDAPLYLTAGLLELDDAEAKVLQVLHHAHDHRPCATIITQVVHATPDGRVFPWPERTRAAAERLWTTSPTYARPRGVPDGAREDPAQAWAAGLTRSSRGPVLPQQCDVFGQMTAQALAGRIAEGMMLLFPPISRAVAAAKPGVRIGAAAVEHRVDYHQSPRAGDAVEVRSRVVAVADKTVRLEHWLCDPDQPRVWAHALLVVAHFDLDRRTAVSAPPEALAALGLPGPDEAQTVSTTLPT